MKNSLLALALFAFVGTATAHDTPGKGKKTAKAGAKKEMCTKGMAAGCCMKGGAMAAAKAPKAAPVAVKSL